MLSFSKECSLFQNPTALPLLHFTSMNFDHTSCHFWILSVVLCSLSLSTEDKRNMKEQILLPSMQFCSNRGHQQPKFFMCKLHDILVTLATQQSNQEIHFYEEIRLCEAHWLLQTLPSPKTSRSSQSKSWHHRFSIYGLHLEAEAQTAVGWQAAKQKRE